MVTLSNIITNPNLMMVHFIPFNQDEFGPISGGHINYAVRCGLFVAGRTSLLRAVCYTLSQMFGSIVGALFLWSKFFGNNWPAARAFVLVQTLTMKLFLTADKCSSQKCWLVTIFYLSHLFLRTCYGRILG